MKDKTVERLGLTCVGLGFFITLGAAGSGDAPGTTPDGHVILWGGLIGCCILWLGGWLLSDELKWRRQDAANRRIQSWFKTGYPIERLWR